MPVRSLVGLLSVALLLSGCAAIRKSNTMNTERMLSASGFQMKIADTPAKREHLQQISPQRQLSPHTINEQLRFVYADLEYCKCVYVGTEAAYQRYQKLAIEKQISNQQLQAANANQAAAMNWGGWGGWGPWY